MSEDFIIKAIISTTFSVAGVLKLLNLDGFKKSLIAFGLKNRFLNLILVITPISELAIAILILSPLTAKLGGILGFLTLLSFAIFLSFHILNNNKTVCNCFGSFSKSPISWWTVVRNLLLATLCLPLVFKDAVPIPNNIWETATLFILVVAITEGFVIYRMKNEIFQLQNNTSNITNENQFISFSLQSTSGSLITLESLITEKRPIVLVFIDPFCKPCEEILPYISIWQDQYSSSLVIQIISRGSLEENKLICQQHNLKEIGIQNDFEVASLFGIPGTPSAILLSPSGIASSNVISGTSEIYKFLTSYAIPDARIISDSLDNSSSGIKEEAKLEIGKLIPKIWLYDANGYSIPIIENDKKTTLILLTGPDFEADHKSLSKLLDESNIMTNDEVYKLLVGSMLPPEKIKGVNKYAIDQYLETNHNLHVKDFPAAVLIDERGKLRIPIASGKQEIKELFQMIEFLTENKTEVIKNNNYYV